MPTGAGPSCPNGVVARRAGEVCQTSSPFSVTSFTGKTCIRTCRGTTTAMPSRRSAMPSKIATGPIVSLRGRKASGPCLSTGNAVSARHGVSLRLAPAKAKDATTTAASRPKLAGLLRRGAGGGSRAPGRPLRMAITLGSPGRRATATRGRQGEIACRGIGSAGHTKATVVSITVRSAAPSLRASTTTRQTLASCRLNR